MVFFSHEAKNGFSIFVGLLFAGRSGIFSVVGEFLNSSQIANGVPIGVEWWGLEAGFWYTKGG